MSDRHGEKTLHAYLRNSMAEIAIAVVVVTPFLAAGSWFFEHSPLIPVIAIVLGILWHWAMQYPEDAEQKTLGEFDD